jgi:hypothetical protein
MRWKESRSSFSPGRMKKTVKRNEEIITETKVNKLLSMTGIVSREMSLRLVKIW